MKKGKLQLSNRRCVSCLCGVALLVLVLGPTGAAFAQFMPADIQALREQGEREGWTFEVAALECNIRIEDGVSVDLSQLLAVYGQDCPTR